MFLPAGCSYPQPTYRAFAMSCKNYAFIISSGCFLGQWYPTCRELTVSKLKFEDPRMGRARHEESLIDSELRS